MLQGIRPSVYARCDKILVEAIDSSLGCGGDCHQGGFTAITNYGVSQM